MVGRKDLSWVVRLSLAVICMLGGSYLFYLATLVKVQRIKKDAFVSLELAGQIETFLSKNVAFSNPVRFIELKKNYPIIDQLDVRMVGLNKIQTNYAVQMPIVKFGANLILTKQKQVFLATDFALAKISNLPQIYLVPEKNLTTEVTSELIHFAAKVMEPIFDTYNINWHDLYEIRLVDKQDAGYQIIIKHDQDLDLALLQQARKLMADDRQKTNKKNCSADLRFDRQIIVAC